MYYENDMKDSVQAIPSGEKLEALLSKLDPKTRKRFLSASNTHKHVLPTASLSVNDMIGGGIPKGAITTVYGNYSSSKTSMMLESIGRWQKQGYVCAFVDAEGTYDKEWAARLGVNNDELLLINKKSFGAITDEIIPLLEAELDVVVIDSITSALPEVFVEDDGTIKEFDKQKQIGAHARSCGIMTNALHYVNKSTAIVYLSQTRTDMSGMHPMQKPSGGKVVEFGSSIMIKLGSSPQEKQQIKGKVMVGDKIHELPIGRPVNFEIVKNKVGPPGGAGTYNFYYSGSKVGVDNVDELVTIGKFYGAIRAGGAWTFFGEEKWQGQPAFVEALKNDKDLFDAVEKEVHLIKTGEIVE